MGHETTNEKFKASSSEWIVQIWPSISLRQGERVGAGLLYGQFNVSWSVAVLCRFFYYQTLIKVQREKGSMNRFAMCTCVYSVILYIGPLCFYGDSSNRKS